MPLVIFIPLLLWLGIVAVPPLFEFVGQELSWLAQTWVLYASLGFMALLAGLMRQWGWWYWLVLSTSVFIITTDILAEPADLNRITYLTNILPLLLAGVGWLLSSRPRPPLWTPAGTSLLLTLAILPYGLSLLPWTDWLELPGLQPFLSGTTSDIIETSWLSWSVLGGVILCWLGWRLKRGSQPRHWSEFALSVLLIGAVMSSQSALLLHCALMALVITVLLGLSVQMLNLAYIDELTQLPGRRALLADMRKLGRRSAITMLDVDHFKKFNDTYGHDVGDQVLKLIAAQLNQEPGCKAYRYGGEEFTLLFKHDDEERIWEHLESVRQRIADYPLHLRSKQRPRKSQQGKQQRGQGSSKRVKVTISLGCAVRQAGESTTVMIKRADALLYKAKKAGRNRAVIG